MTLATAPTPVRMRSAARWTIVPSPDAGVVRVLEGELRLPAAVCALLAARGYHAPDAAKRFLRPRLVHLHDPVLLAGMSAAVERITGALDRGERILVHGDYDVDGMTATTILTRTLRLLGGDVVPFVPQRLTDGYDLTSAGVRAARSHGAALLITADCGTSAVQPVAELKAQGIDAIVCDHHLPGGPLPDCVALLNPRAPGCPYPDKDLCAAAVVFKLAQALLRARGVSENAVLGMLDLVALATVADVAPLRGENRVLVRYGLRLMQETRNVGLRALIRAAGLEGKDITAGRVAFVLAPRLNAAGRVGHALRGVELLLEEDEGAALASARQLEEWNLERQALDRRTLHEALELAERLDLESTRGIVLASPTWHPGVIGIVASRLVEEFTRPVVLVAIEGDIGKGSGRSTGAFDLHGGIGACRHLLLRFGGHRVAAGLTIAADRIDDFAKAFNAVASERLTPDDLIPELRLDCELALDTPLSQMQSVMRHFEPFGVGNPAPTFLSKRVAFEGAPRAVGADGLKLHLQTPHGPLEAIGWGACVANLPELLGSGNPLDLAYRLERDVYRGEERLIARIAAVRA
ncbi:MAG: single-stranded-DNA-specific exonuclease RecJ [Gemmatimonadaceae bacterium]